MNTHNILYSAVAVVAVVVVAAIEGGKIIWQTKATILNNVLVLVVISLQGNL